MKSKDEILQILDNVKDPEIPVVSIVDMGMVRDVEFRDDKTIVVITPTYSGCPAMYEIRKDSVAELKKHGIENVGVREQLSPAWTTDWMTESTRQKLKDYGIAPPDKKVSSHIDKLFAKEEPVQCPICNGKNTVTKSKFGSTACKSLHYCKDCDEPFEHFKCH